MMIYHRKRGNDEMMVQSLKVFRKVRGSMRSDRVGRHAMCGKEKKRR